MKNILFILIFTILISCKSTQTVSSPVVETQVEKTPETMQVDETLKIALENLTKEQREKLNERIPQKVREILDNAEELEILSLVANQQSDKQVNLDIGYPFIANKTARITDKKLINNLLNAIYLDGTTDERISGCWTPHHGLRVNHKGKTVTLGICYHCGHFHGKSPSGKFGGAIGDENSLAIFDSIIEKYGADVQ